MALLEPEQLAQADARLASLVERFNQVPESLQKLPDLTKENFKLPIEENQGHFTREILY